MLNGLDLFSGIGGISLALRDYVRPIAYCEIDPYCQAVLLSRISDGLLPNCPIWDDVKTLQGSDFRGAPDIIYGGFPCQDISVAGRGAGLAGERSGLFFEIMRLAEEIKPSFIFLENVPAICTRGGLDVIRKVAEMGYDCRWCVISAASVGALHRRERWFLLANAKREGLERHGNITRKKKESQFRNDGICNNNSQPSKQTDSGTQSKQEEKTAWGRSTGQYWPFESRERWKETVSRVCRTSDGVSFQVDRIKSLGNAVVAQQAKEAFEILMGYK